MKYYAGLDVSLEETFVSIIDENGQIIKEGAALSSGEALGHYLKKTGLTFKKIGIESGQLSIYLCKSLRAQGFDVICIDARHAAAALSARINKNDKNDARGIAQILRTGWEKKVTIKSDKTCERKVLMGIRGQLVSMRTHLVGTMRGLLKIYGVKLGLKNRFPQKVHHIMKDLPLLVQRSLEASLGALAGIEASLEDLDKKVIALVKEDEDCKRLMTVPGVGAITALNFMIAIDDPGRFKESETVGAYLGMTPKQYASGQVDRHGRISKMGPKACRTSLYEAAQVLLRRSKKPSNLKSWAMRLAKKKGNKKAIVALARKLSVVMHRMLANKTEFCYE